MDNINRLVPRVRYVKEMKEYMQNEEWKSFMPNDEIKKLFEEKILNAKPPK